MSCQSRSRSDASYGEVQTCGWLGGSLKRRFLSCRAFARSVLRAGNLREARAKCLCYWQHLESAKPKDANPFWRALWAGWCPRLYRRFITTQRVLFAQQVPGPSDALGLLSHWPRLIVHDFLSMV